MRFIPAPLAGKTGQKPLQALATGCRPELRGSERCQGRLGFPESVQQSHRVQCGPAFTQPSLRIVADRPVAHQPVAGRGWRAVALDHGGAVPDLLQELEGGA